MYLGFWYKKEGNKKKRQNTQHKCAHFRYLHHGKDDALAA